MRRISSDIICPCCQSKITMRYQKPTLMSVTRFTQDCGECGAKYQIAVRRKRGGGNQVEFQTGLISLPTKVPESKAAKLFTSNASLQALNKPREVKP